jgi:hypothetical protein
MRKTTLCIAPTFSSLLILAFFFFAPLKAHAALTDGLVGWWTFNDPDITNNLIVDRSGQGNNGGFIGGSTSSAKTIGKLGQALKFDGVDDYIQTPFNQTLLPATITAWVTVDAADLAACDA